MKVIVAGFPKTGTKSMVAALTKLGYKVYDYIENVYLLEKEWTKIANEGWTTEDFRQMYDDVDAVTDFPACSFWEEIYRAFPDAKIILTMRENDEVWVESFANQLRVAETNVWHHVLQFLSPTQVRIAKNILWPLVTAQLGLVNRNQIKDVDEKKTLLKFKYRAHNAYVLQNAPADQLLVYKPSEGWEPLCRFLGKPVPNEPFPHKNVRGKFMDDLIATHPLFKRLKKEVIISLSIITGVLGLGTYYCIMRRHEILGFVTKISFFFKRS